MLLIGGRFLALVAGPFLFEFSGRHAHSGTAGQSGGGYVARIHMAPNQRQAITASRSNKLSSTVFVTNDLCY